MCLARLSGSHSTASLLDLNPVYFNTHFKREAADDWGDMPGTFAIINAYPTTGEKWPQSQIDAADQKLEAELRERSKWLRRLTGYDPGTGWAEPGWAADIGFDDACDVGERFKQDAIYFVDNRELFVSFCDKRRSRVRVASFAERLR